MSQENDTGHGQLIPPSLPPPLHPSTGIPPKRTSKGARWIPGSDNGVVTPARLSSSSERVTHPGAAIGCVLGHVCMVVIDVLPRLTAITSPPPPSTGVMSPRPTT